MDKFTYLNIYSLVEIVKVKIFRIVTFFFLFLILIAYTMIIFSIYIRQSGN